MAQSNINIAKDSKMIDRRVNAPAAHLVVPVIDGRGRGAVEKLTQSCIVSAASSCVNKRSSSGRVVIISSGVEKLCHCNRTLYNNNKGARQTGGRRRGCCCYELLLAAASKSMELINNNEPA